MRKVCITTANRCDFSRLETVIEAVRAHPGLELQLVVYGSHLLDKAGRTISDIEKKGIKIDRTLYMEIAGGNPTTMAKSVGLGIIELSTIFDELKPDIVLVHGDRYEAFAVGSTASMMNIRVGHIQGGEVTGTIDESIRHALTKMSHFHLVSTEKSKERVIRMGEDPTYVFNVGCSGTDVLLRADVLKREETISLLNKEVIKTTKLDPKLPYILMMQHPVTTEYEDSGSQILETIEALKRFKEQIIVVWPNIDAGSEELSSVLRRHSFMERKGVKAFKHIPSHIFANVVRNASCLVGNSSSGPRETCYFGTPVVNIGSRQSDRERGSNVINVSHDRKEIARAIRTQLSKKKYPVEYGYGDGTAGVKTAEICARIKLPSVQKKICY